MRPLHELRGVERAVVFKAGVPAATLERRRNAVAFAYDPGYLTDGEPPVATTLPLSEVPVLTHAAGALPPFFSGLLPEGAGSWRCDPPSRPRWTTSSPFCSPWAGMRWVMLR